MDLLILGAGMGIVGGLLPSPMHLIALAQVALGRWVRALFVLVGAPLLVDGFLLLVTFFFYRLVPPGIAHYVAYVGGLALTSFAIYSLWELRAKTPEEMAGSVALSYASVSVALLAQLAAPGTWIYWLTIAGPILSEGRQHGYWHVVPFFVGGVVGFYGAAVFAVWLMAWGASLHKRFKQHLFLIANILLLIMGISYLVRAYLGQ
jgi:threonine/homoserine/homoserine lactone efflux protein